MNTQKVIDLASDLHPSMLLSRWLSDYLLLLLVLGVLQICARGHLDEIIITIITFTGTGSRYVTYHLVFSPPPWVVVGNCIGTKHKSFCHKNDSEGCLDVVGILESPKEDGDNPEKRMTMLIWRGNHCCATLARVPLRPLGESKEPICISVNLPKPQDSLLHNISYLIILSFYHGSTLSGISQSIIV